MEQLGCYGLNQIQTRLAKWNLTAKKRWGQNFLLDRGVCKKIVKTALNTAGTREGSIDAIQRVWEIGPGLAGLTEVLLDIHRARNITLFEIDYGIIRMLEDAIHQLQLSQYIHIVRGDASSTIAKLSNTLVEEEIPQLICGNLPYSSGVKILIACSHIVPTIALNTGNTALHYVPMSVMLQKEAAERIASPVNNKSYGVSTVLLQVMYDITIKYGVSPELFYPKPQVESVICSLVPRTQIPLYTMGQIKILREIVQASFMQRRKKLNNTLGKFLEGRKITQYDHICAEAGIDLQARAENISPDHYMKLALLLDTIPHSEKHPS